MDFKVIWLEPAIEDLRELIGFIPADNANAARELGTRILDAVEVLSHFPASGRIYPALKRSDVRQVSVPPHRVIYHLRTPGRTVNLLPVWHGARQLPNLRDLAERGLDDP